MSGAIRVLLMAETSKGNEKQPKTTNPEKAG